MIVLSDADRVFLWWQALEKLLSPALVAAPGSVMMEPDGARRPPTDEEHREVAQRRLAVAFVAADVIVAEYERRGAAAHKSQDGDGGGDLSLLERDDGEVSLVSR